MRRFIGLDVHKTVVEVCATDEAGKVLFRRRMDCTREVLLEFAKELTTEDAVASLVLAVPRSVSGRWGTIWQRTRDEFSEVAHDR